MPHAVSGARGRVEQLSEMTKIITSDRVLELGEAKPFDEAWDRAKVDQKDLDEHRNSWPSWRQSRNDNAWRVSIGERELIAGCSKTGSVGTSGNWTPMSARTCKAERADARTSPSRRSCWSSR